MGVQRKECLICWGEGGAGKQGFLGEVILELNLAECLEVICSEKEPCELRRSECYHMKRDELYSVTVLVCIWRIVG